MAESRDNETYLQQAAGMVNATYNAIMRGGQVQAAFRQGADEIGVALKAFPDSIQVNEPGAVLSPLYSDIAADKRAALYGNDQLPSPSQIAEGNAGSIYGESLQHDQSIPSPSDIAENTEMHSQTGLEQEHVHDRGTRGM